MAGIETYLNLTELHYEMARDKRQAEDEAERAQAVGQIDDRLEMRARRRTLHQQHQEQHQQQQEHEHGARNIITPTPAYQFAKKQAKRMGAPQVSTASITKSKVSAWLNVSGNSTGGKQQPDGPKRYTRHQPLRLTKGTWQTRTMSRLALINHSLPIFSPFSTGRKSWEMFIMVMVLYNAVSVPLDLSFGMPTQGNIVTYVEYAIDLLFAIDIVGNFRTAFVDAQGHLVRDTDAIAYKYLRTWFAVDLFATIPYDLILTAILKGSMNSTQVLVLKLLRTPRLLRLGRLVRIIDRFKSANLIRIVVIVCGMVLISHWLACIWYMLYKFTTFADYLEWGMFVNGAISPDQTLGAYLSAYYQSFLMMVGNNQPSHNNLERIFMILVLIMGACFYSAMVGQMAVLVANMNTVSLRHRTKQDTTLDVLRYMGLPDKQMARAQAYFNYITQFNHPATEGLAFLSDLPKALFDELTVFLYRQHLTEIPLFSDLEPAFLSALAGRMRIVTFTSEETIFRAGDLGLEMYIIRKGFVAVVGKGQQMMGLLAAGEHFGEIAMLTQAKRTARCVALSNCDLCVLTTYDLKMVMKDFPASSQALQDKAGERLLQLQVAGRAGYVEGEEADDEEYEDEDEVEEEEEEEEEEQQEGVARRASRDRLRSQVTSGRTVRRSTDSSGQVLRPPGTSDGVAQVDATSKGPDTSKTSPRAVGEAFEDISASTPPERQVQIQIVRHDNAGDKAAGSSAASGPVATTWNDTGSWGLVNLGPKGLHATAIAEGREDIPESPSRAESANNLGRQASRQISTRRGSITLPNGTEDMQAAHGTPTWLRNTKSTKGLLSSSIPLADDRSSITSCESPFHQLLNQPSTNKRSVRSSAQSQLHSRLLHGSADGVGPQPSGALRSHRTNASRRHSNLSVASAMGMAMVTDPQQLLGPRQHVELCLSRMLAHSQSQVAELQQELQAAKQELELDKNMRAQLYNQTAMLVQLLEHLSDRIDYTEELTLDMEERISALERGQHSTVLGTNLNHDAPEPRMARSPSVAAMGRAPSMARSASMAAKAHNRRVSLAITRKSSFVNAKAADQGL